VIACAIPEPQQAAAALGIDDYLLKPVLPDQLLAALDRLSIRGGTVLVVDDEPEARRLFQRMLGSAQRGYRVLEASNGEHGLNILRDQHPDVVLLDLVMPELDGFRFLEARAKDPKLCDIPVVVISARDPGGQTIVSRALAVTRGGGLSTSHLLVCVEALSRILGTMDQAGDPTPTETPPG
jgi:CheY-like chemotaxis protein